MSAWTNGYVADVGYTYGYYTEINPLRIKLAFISQGFVFPEVGAACELGFGQGLSVTMHAAASVVEWYGTDFNPSQVGFAQDLLEVSGSHARLFDESFDEFSQREDLPQFDYIALHGIWSWINDENRRIIVDFIRKRLKVGGVLYVSYNTQPGWASFTPMRHLLTLHSQSMGCEGRGVIGRIDDALEFMDRLMATNPMYAKVNTQVSERLERIKGQPRSYLAHEYFNRDWMPMHFATMADWLEPAKVQFACSAMPLELVDVIQFTPEQQALLGELSDVRMREGTRDFMINQQFRRDYWVRGIRKLNVVERLEAARSLRIVLVSYRPEISLVIKTQLGEATLNASVYTPILDILSDNKPRTLGQIEKLLDGTGITFNQIMQSVLILAGVGHLATANEDRVVSKVRPATDRLNGYLINKSRGSDSVDFLVSPVVGGGVHVNSTQRLLIMAVLQGRKKPEEWAQFAWEVLQKQNQKIIKDGKTLNSPDENIEELNNRVAAFGLRIPMFKALMIIP